MILINVKNAQIRPEKMDEMAGAGRLLCQGRQLRGRLLVL